MKPHTDVDIDMNVFSDGPYDFTLSSCHVDLGEDLQHIFLFNWILTQLSL